MEQDSLYREVGEALHLAQTLEVNIRTLVSIMNRYYRAQIDSKLLIVGDDRRTLGQLIREIQKRAEFDQAGINALSDALEARNYATHRFFIHNIGAFKDSVLCSKATSDLKKCAKQIAIGTAISSALIQGLCEVLNIEQSDILIEQGL